MPAPQESCNNCRFFLALASTDEPGKGICRIAPPRHERTTQVEIASDDGRWPLCLSHEWCGKWQLKT